MNADALNAVIGAGGVLIGIVVAYVFYRVSIRSKKPVYALLSTALVRDFTSRFEALEILYAGSRISNLTATKVAIWNDGKATIDGADVTDADPLMLKVKDQYRILNANLLHQSNKANKLSLQVSDDARGVLVGFDYLDHGEGGVIQILHTGKGSGDVEVLGRLKGAGKPQRRKIPRFSPPRVTFLKSRPVFAAIMFLLPVGLLVLFFLVVPPPIPLSPVFKVIATLVAVLPYWESGVSVLRRRVPRGFDVFEEEIEGSAI